MKITLISAALAVSLVAGCKEDKADVAVASCTMEELQTKSMEVAQGLQTNPAAAQDMMAKMQELAPRLQGMATTGEADPELVNELCVAYDDMIAKL